MYLTRQILLMPDDKSAMTSVQGRLQMARKGYIGCVYAVYKILAQCSNSSFTLAVQSGKNLTGEHACKHGFA